jgi:hypothetical protein
VRDPNSQCDDEFCTDPPADAGQAPDDAGPMSMEPMETLSCGDPPPTACGSKAACPDGEACVAKACKGLADGRDFLGAETLQPDADDYGTYPELAVNAKGAAAVAWIEDSNLELRASIFDVASGHWGPQTPVSAAGAMVPDMPHVAVDPAGNAIVIWHQGGNPSRSIWANRYDASSGAFAGPVALQSDQSGFSEYVRVAVDPDGNAIAVWLHYGDDQLSRIHSSRYDVAANTWSEPQPIDLDITQGSSDADVVVDRDGNAIAAWVELDDVNSWQNVYAARFDRATATWSEPERIDTDDTGGDNHPRLSADAAGDVFVTWHQVDDPERAVVQAWANRYDVYCKRWGDAVQLDDGQAPNRDIVYTDVAADAKGDALAVWNQDSHVFASRYDAKTATWTEAEQIEFEPSTVVEPRIAVDDGGRGIAVWQQDFSGRQAAVASRYDPSTHSWSPRQALDSDVDDRSFTPQVAIDAEGRALVIWYQLASQKYKVRSARFE